MSSKVRNSQLEEERNSNIGVSLPDLNVSSESQQPGNRADGAPRKSVKNDKQRDQSSKHEKRRSNSPIKRQDT